MSMVRTGVISNLDQSVGPAYYENYDRIFGKWKPQGIIGQIKKTNKEMSVFDDRNSSISLMMKDKTMVKMIKNGNGSDPGIKRTALAIEQEKATKRKQSFYQERFKRLEEAKRSLQLAGSR